MDAWTVLSDVVRQELPPAAGDVPLESIAGWDSLKMVKMVLRLEELLNRKLSEGELEGLQTAGDIDRLLQGDLGADAG